MSIKPITALALALTVLACAPAMAQTVKTDLYTVTDGYKVDPDTMKASRVDLGAKLQSVNRATGDGYYYPAGILAP